MQSAPDDMSFFKEKMQYSSVMENLLESATQEQPSETIFVKNPDGLGNIELQYTRVARHFRLLIQNTNTSFRSKFPAIFKKDERWKLSREEIKYILSQRVDFAPYLEMYLEKAIERIKTIKKKEDSCKKLEALEFMKSVLEKNLGDEQGNPQKMFDVSTQKTKIVYKTIPHEYERDVFIDFLGIPSEERVAAVKKQIDSVVGEIIYTEALGYEENEEHSFGDISIEEDYANLLLLIGAILHPEGTIEHEFSHLVRRINEHYQSEIDAYRAEKKREYLKNNLGKEYIPGDHPLDDPRFYFLDHIEHDGYHYIELLHAIYKLVQSFPEKEKESVVFNVTNGFCRMNMAKCFFYENLMEEVEKNRKGKN